MGQKVLLAPIPRDHILSARERAAETGGEVAFGTGAYDPGKMWEFFSRQAEPGMDVLIYVSTTGSGEYYGHVFSHAANYLRIVADEKEIRHIRPKTALATDYGHGCYWVVKNFRKLDEKDFLPFSRYKISPPLHGPVVKMM